MSTTKQLKVLLNKVSSLFQVLFWILLAIAWLLPLLWSLILHNGFAELERGYKFNCIYYDYRVLLAVLMADVSVIVIIMFIMSVIITVLYCKLRGKETDTPTFLCQAMFCCCLCSVLFTLDEVLSIIGSHSAGGSMNLWYVALISQMSRPGMSCLLWILICKDIRTSVLCRPGISDEEVELITNRSESVEGQGTSN